MEKFHKIPRLHFVSIFGTDDVSKWPSRDLQLLNAIYSNETSKVVQLLQSSSTLRVLGQFKIPLLSLAIDFGHREMVECLITAGCDARTTEQNGTTPLHQTLKFYGGYETESKCAINPDAGRLCSGCAIHRHRPDLAKLLLDSMTPRDAIENIFFAEEKRGAGTSSGAGGRTPFVQAIVVACDPMIELFLDYLPSDSSNIPFEKLSSPFRPTIFHELFEQSMYHILGNAKIGDEFVTMPLTPCPSAEAVEVRTRNIRMMIEKLPHFDRATNVETIPLDVFMFNFVPEQPPGVFTNLIEILRSAAIRLGSLEVKRHQDGRTFLELAVRSEDPEFVETLLRMGCEPELSLGFDIQSSLCSPMTTEFSHVVRIIELLLAFGYDLSKEIHGGQQLLQGLSDGAELMRAKREEVWRALLDLNDSGELINLKRMCRKVIRRCLKPNADEKVEELMGVSPAVKVYLQVKKEPNRKLMDINFN